MTNAKACLQSTLYRFFLIACFAILVTVFLPAVPQAQQSTVLPQLCQVETRSSCNTCGSCQTGPSCPAGYTVYDDYCLPECPNGYLRYPGYPGICTPPSHHGCPEGYEHVPLPNCPQGYHRDIRNVEECVPDRTAYPDNCPEGLGYSQETGKCSPICPEGTYLAEDGLCHSYYDKACPDGYGRNPLTGACVPGGNWPDDYKWICLPACPQGFTRDIYHPTRCLPPPETCPQGFENFRQQCVPVCEQGTSRNAYGYCLPPRCEDGSYPNLRGVCQPTACPEGYDNIRGQCYPPCEQGSTHNLRDPSQCDRIPGNEPECPQGTIRNEQTGDCDRIPPPPVNCKQGLLYNLKTKQCEPPPRVETNCPKGFTKLKSGKCMRIVRQPDCPPNYVLNQDTGDCEPLQLNVPGACPDGTIFSRKRQRCIPFVNEQQPPLDQGQGDQPNLLAPQLNLNKLVPQLQKKCPDGTALDKNGRCVPLQ